MFGLKRSCFYFAPGLEAVGVDLLSGIQMLMKFQLLLVVQLKLTFAIRSISFASTILDKLSTAQLS
jgi:hypothetical protein